MMAHAQNACSSSEVGLRVPVSRSSAQILGLGSFRSTRRSVWPPAVNSRPRGGVGCGGQAPSRVGAFLLRCGDQAGQYGQAFAGPLVGARFVAAECLPVRELAGAHRAGDRPLRPPGRVGGGPFGDVGVETPHRGQVIHH